MIARTRARPPRAGRADDDEQVVPGRVRAGHIARLAGETEHELAALRDGATERRPRSRERLERIEHRDPLARIRGFRIAGIANAITVCIGMRTRKVGTHVARVVDRVLILVVTYGSADKRISDRIGSVDRIRSGRIDGEAIIRFVLEPEPATARLDHAHEHRRA